MSQTAEKEPKSKKRAPAKERLKHIEIRHYNADEAAFRLGISIWHLLRLRALHPLYRPDVLKPIASTASDSKTRRGPKTPEPLWSKELLDFISHAWSVTQDGPPVRELEDDEAFELWNGMRDEERQRYRKKAGY